MTDPIGMTRSETHVSFTARRDYLERFEKIIAKADQKKGLAESMVVCASMLAAVQAQMMAAFGREEARAIVEGFVEEMFRITRPQ